MQIKRHKRKVLALIVCLGTLLGAGCSLLVGRAIQTRAVIRGLSEYAYDLDNNSMRYALEIGAAWDTFHASPFPFCSPQELAAMQGTIFRSLEMKDIGLNRNGAIYCSGLVGRLNVPRPLPADFLLLTNGAKLYQNPPLEAGGSPGMMIELGDVDVFFSSSAYDYWARPHAHYAMFLTNPDSGKIMQIAGNKLQVDARRLLTQQEWRSGEEIYRSRCNPIDKVCAVTYEASNDIWMGAEPLLISFAGLGALAGFGLSFAGGQSYLRRAGLAQQLRRAIRKETVTLEYQPIFELPSRRVVGAEALVRWSDDDNRPIAPDFFVRIAEQNGFIGELTALVVRKCMRELGPLLRQNPGFTVSINIAPSDLGSEQLFAVLDEHVLKARIPPSQVALEITERSTADLDVMNKSVRRLHDCGYRVHIDDFGTGFSSLFYLHELEVDAIKIDRAFTRTLGTDAVTASILPQILSMAESLTLDVIVEGVETNCQVDYLEATGKALRAQGWFFARPLTASALPDCLDRVETPAVAANPVLAGS